MHVGLNLIFLVPGETGGMEVAARELIPALLSQAPAGTRFTAFINRETAAEGPGPWGTLVPAVTVPVLVAQGIDDPYGSLRQVEAIERQCGGLVRRCILERCGHSPHREQRERTLSTMAAFVRGTEKG